MTHITSRKNAEVMRMKKLLDNSAFRKSEGVFVCHGDVMLKEAQNSGMSIERIFALPEYEEKLPKGIQAFTVAPEIMEVISGVKSANGLVFTCSFPKHEKMRGSRFIALEDVRDPGNVGTVIRTADALGLDGVIFLGSCADCFSPKTVRSTMGSIFRMPLFFMTAEELRDKCDENKISLIGARLSHEARVLKKDSLPKSCCVMIGNEARGISDSAVKLLHSSYIIPMHGAESLNAAVAASIFMWEMTEDSR